MSRLAALAAPLVLSCNIQRPIPLATAADAAPLRVVSTEPADGAQDVPLNQPIDVYLDFAPDPDTVGPRTLVATSGVFYWLGTEQVDLLRRRIRFQALHDFYPGTHYVATLAAGVRSVDGRTFAQPFHFRFATGATETPQAPPPVVTLTGDIEPVFTRMTASGVPLCSGSGCHMRGEAGEAAAGLDLGSADAAFSSLIGQPSVEVPSEARVAPGDSARSEIIRKLGGIPPAIPHALPADRQPSEAELLLIEDWIDAGAPR